MKVIIPLSSWYFSHVLTSAFLWLCKPLIWGRGGVTGWSWAFIGQILFFTPCGVHSKYISLRPRIELSTFWGWSEYLHTRPPCHSLTWFPLRGAETEYEQFLLAWGKDDMKYHDIHKKGEAHEILLWLDLASQIMGMLRKEAWQPDWKVRSSGELALNPYIITRDITLIPLPPRSMKSYLPIPKGKATNLGSFL